MWSEMTIFCRSIFRVSISNLVTPRWSGLLEVISFDYRWYFWCCYCSKLYLCLAESTLTLLFVITMMLDIADLRNARSFDGLVQSFLLFFSPVKLVVYDQMWWLNSSGYLMLYPETWFSNDDDNGDFRIFWTPYIEILQSFTWPDKWIKMLKFTLVRRDLLLLTWIPICILQKSKTVLDTSQYFNQTCSSCWH